MYDHALQSNVQKFDHIFIVHVYKSFAPNFIALMKFSITYFSFFININM